MVAGILDHACKLISKRKAMPSNLIFYVTNKCNCKCSHCFFWNDLNKSENDAEVGVGRNPGAISTPRYPATTASYKKERFVLMMLIAFRAWP